MSTEPQLRPSRHLAFVVGDEVTYVFPLHRARAGQVPLALTGTGRYLFSAVQQSGGATRSELSDGAVADFPDADATQVRADVETFVADLLARGVLETTSPGITPAG